MKYTLAIAALLALSAVPGAASANTRVRVDVGRHSWAWLREGPGANFKITGKAFNGEYVNVVCSEYGTAPPGARGNSLWYRLDNNSYISDGFVNTGTTEPIEDSCSIIPPY